MPQLDLRLLRPSVFPSPLLDPSKFLVAKSRAVSPSAVSDLPERYLAGADPGPWPNSTPPSAARTLPSIACSSPFGTPSGARSRPLFPPPAGLTQAVASSRPSSPNQGAMGAPRGRPLYRSRSRPPPAALASPPPPRPAPAPSSGRLHLAPAPPPTVGLASAGPRAVSGPQPAPPPSPAP